MEYPLSLVLIDHGIFSRLDAPAAPWYFCNLGCEFSCGALVVTGSDSDQLGIIIT